MLRFIGNAITADDSSMYLKSKGIQVIDAHIWLEELKDRVQPQLKQEWSEEVEDAISLLKHIAEEQEKDYCPYNANNLRKAVKYLETCRPQSHCKPSEEQMKALKEAVDEHFDIDGGALWHLYNDLKKLREE